MLNQSINRRKALQFLGAAAGLSAVEKARAAGVPVKEKPKFIYSLNMATIRGHKLGFVKELETASAAGFRSVEIWIDTLDEYLNSGGTIGEAKKHLDGLGLTVEDCISFTEWIADDDNARKAGLEQMKTEMGLLAHLGCKRIAATGKGIKPPAIPSLDVIAERYRTTLLLGDQFGIIPQIEMWGFQKNLSDVAEVLYIAMESRHPSAKILLDIFHLYRGNTSLDTLPLISPNAVDILHMNDYPAGMPYETITDADRIYPGDGIAPLTRILKTLYKTGKPLVLSAELFNKAYYQQPALTVAKTVLNKMKAVVAALD